MVPAGQPQPVAIAIPRRVVRKNFGPAFQAALLEVCHEAQAKSMNAVGAHWLAENDDQMKSPDPVGIEEQRIEAPLDQALPPAAAMLPSLETDRLSSSSCRSMSIASQREVKSLPVL
jgi:hypothetical protein